MCEIFLIPALVWDEFIYFALFFKKISTYLGGDQYGIGDSVRPG